MLFMFYFAIFVNIARNLLRPGVLWFLRNPNEPTFDPLQEMVRGRGPGRHSPCRGQRGAYAGAGSGCSSRRPPRL